MDLSFINIDTFLLAAVSYPSLFDTIFPSISRTCRNYSRTNRRGVTSPVPVIQMVVQMSQHLSRATAETSVLGQGVCARVSTRDTGGGQVNVGTKQHRNRGL